MQKTWLHDHDVSGREEARATSIMREEQDHEIDLREYIGIAVKRKKIVLASFLIPTLLAALWGAVSPKIYEVSAIIGPPIMSVTDSGVQEFDSVGDIKAEIETGAFNTKIINELNIPEKGLKFDVSQPRDAKVIKISLKRTVDQVDGGKKILAKLIEALSLNYAKFIEDKHNRIENQIKVTVSQIGRKENEIKLKNEQFKILAAREQQYVEEIKETKANSEKLFVNRVALFDRKENKDDISALLYTATIQQNISYFTQLQNELAEVRIRKESVLNGVENLKTGISEDRIGIENLRLSEEVMHNIAVIQEPLVSLRPIGPRVIQNIFIAGVIGVCAGLFSIFFAEYLAGFPA